MRNVRERGAVMVEFALIVPILLLLVLGIIEYGYRYQRAAVLSNAAFVAAREFSINKNTGDAQAAARASDDAMPASAVISVPGCTAGNVTVTITVTQDSPTGFFGGGTFDAEGKGAARCED